MTAEYLTVQDLAELTTLAEPTLYFWRKTGKGPRSFKLGGRVVYSAAEVRAWIASQEQATSRGGAA